MVSGCQVPDAFEWPEYIDSHVRVELTSALDTVSPRDTTLLQVCLISQYDRTMHFTMPEASPCTWEIVAIFHAEGERNPWLYSVRPQIAEDCTPRDAREFSIEPGDTLRFQPFSWTGEVTGTRLPPGSYALQAFLVDHELVVDGKDYYSPGGELAELVPVVVADTGADEL